MKKSAPDPLYELSSEEIDYYRQNPDNLHELLSRETVRKQMIGWVLLAAAFLVTISKLIPYFFGDFLGSFVSEVLIDLVFEMGAALMGAIATLVFIEIAQAGQYEENKRLYRTLKAKLHKESLQKSGAHHD